MTTVFVEFVRAGKEHREFASLMRRREKIPHCCNKTQCRLRRDARLASPGSDAGVKHQTQGWARTAQVAMPGEASGDAMLPSAGGNKIAIQASPGQYHFVGMRRREEPGLRSRARLDPLEAVLGESR